MVAVAAEHWEWGYKDDPRYIQWAATIMIVSDGVVTTNHYPMHQCTDEEFNSFYKIEDQSAIKVAQLQAARQLQCLHPQA